MSDKIYTAALLIIGNEILSGRTLDKNTQYIGGALTKAGIRLAEVRIVPDIEGRIVEALDALRAQVDYVFTTGGIGPTHDDITAACVAKAFARPLILHPEAHQILLDYYGPEELTAPRLKMAQTPEGASLIPNPVSGAPGFQIDNVYVMAGVPRIMQGMFDHILPRLKGGAEILSESLTFQVRESVIAEPLGRIQDLFPAIDIGSYPQYREGIHAVSVVLRGTDKSLIAQAAEELRKMAKELDCMII